MMIAMIRQGIIHVRARFVLLQKLEFLICNIIDCYDTWQELHIMFGVRECGMDFSSTFFKFSAMDCINIGLGLKSAKCIQTFR
jgi:tRNA splicing ligase